MNSTSNASASAFGPGEFSESTNGYVFSGSVGWSDVAYVGIGFGVKPLTFRAEFLDPALEMNTTTYDFGLLLSGRVARFDGHSVRAALGVARINEGGSIELGGPSTRLATWSRYGLNVQFTSRTWTAADDYFHATLPVVSAMIEFDVEQELERGSGKRSYNSGLELGVLQMLFLRAGYIHDESRGGTQAASFGLGAGATFKKVRARFDYAHAPFSNSNDINYFGLTASVDL